MYRSKVIFLGVSMGFGAFLGQGGKNLENPPKIFSTHGEGLRRSWTGDMTWFFLLFHGFGAVLSYFRIWIVCMKVWDRCETCAFLQCARLHAPSSSLLYIYIYIYILQYSTCFLVLLRGWCHPGNTALAREAMARCGTENAWKFPTMQ